MEFMHSTAKNDLSDAVSSQMGQVCAYSHLCPLSLRDTVGLVRTTGEGGYTVNLLLSKPELNNRQCAEPKMFEKHQSLLGQGGNSSTPLSFVFCDG